LLGTNELFFLLLLTLLEAPMDKNDLVGATGVKNEAKVEDEDVLVVLVVAFCCIIEWWTSRPRNAER
jgi:hypothetical protein